MTATGGEPATAHLNKLKGRVVYRSRRLLNGMMHELSLKFASIYMVRACSPCAVKTQKPDLLIDDMESVHANVTVLPNNRGSYNCCDMLAVLGTAFEPFVIKVLPHLLTRFGNERQEVRKAMAAASKVMMKNLSNFGIKMVLLVALDKNDWRTKVQSAQMLGQMASARPMCWPRTCRR